MSIAADSRVGFVKGGAYENYTGTFIRDWNGRALVVVDSPEEMVVGVAYDQLVTDPDEEEEQPERDIWDEADEAYAAHKEDPDNW